MNFELFKKEYKEIDKSLDLNWTYGKGKKYFSDRIKSKNSLVEVAEYENKIIGYSCGSLVGSFIRKGIHAEMEDSIIEKDFRRMGIGSVFVKNFLKWCKTKKVNFISVVITAQNEPSINFVKKLGFKEYTVIMEKKLR